VESSNAATLSSWAQTKVRGVPERVLSSCAEILLSRLEGSLRPMIKSILQVVLQWLSWLQEEVSSSVVLSPFAGTLPHLLEKDASANTRTTGEALEGLILLQWRVEPSRGFPCFRTVTNMVAIDRSRPWRCGGLQPVLNNSLLLTLQASTRETGKGRQRQRSLRNREDSHSQQEFRRPSKLHQSINKTQPLSVTVSGS